MEKSTVIGITAGLASIGIGMYLKGADPHALINPAAYLIIFAGTAAALFNAFTMKELKRFPVLCKIIFCGQKLTENKKFLNSLLTWLKRPSKTASSPLKNAPTK